MSDVIKRIRGNVQFCAKYSAVPGISSQQALALLDVAEAAQRVPIGAAILALLEDTSPAFTPHRIALLDLRAALSRLGSLT